MYNQKDISGVNVCNANTKMIKIQLFRFNELFPKRYLDYTYPSIFIKMKNALYDTQDVTSNKNFSSQVVIFTKMMMPKRSKFKNIRKNDILLIPLWLNA